MNVKRTVKGYIKAGFAGIIINDQIKLIPEKRYLWRNHSLGQELLQMLEQMFSPLILLFLEKRLRSFCNVYPLVPKLANMLESGGKVPILNPLELEEIAYKLVAYPISLIGVSIQAMQDALLAIKGGRIPSPGSMASFEEIEEILGFETYLEEEKWPDSWKVSPTIQHCSSFRRREFEAIDG
ncbi:unnamed protein product [Arabidopsis lyrata]|nr:unnamed protein product [Arabidopsis lyrata]